MHPTKANNRAMAILKITRVPKASATANTGCPPNVMFPFGRDGFTCLLYTSVLALLKGGKLYRESADGCIIERHSCRREADIIGNPHVVCFFSFTIGSYNFFAIKPGYLFCFEMCIRDSLYP